jgi:hypothetical protein
MQLRKKHSTQANRAQTPHDPTNHPSKPTIESGSLISHFTGRFVAEAILIGGIAWIALRQW